MNHALNETTVIAGVLRVPTVNTREDCQSESEHTDAHIQAREHLLTKCPLFHQQRVDAVITTDHRTLSLKQLFQTHPDRLLAFLQAPGIARPPPNTSQREWVEEEADTGVG